MKLESCGKGTGEPDCRVLDTAGFGFVQKSPVGGFGSTTLTHVPDLPLFHHHCHASRLRESDCSAEPNIPWRPICIQTCPKLRCPPTTRTSHSGIVGRIGNGD